LTRGIETQLAWGGEAAREGVGRVSAAGHVNVVAAKPALPRLLRKPNGGGHGLLEKTTEKMFENDAPRWKMQTRPLRRDFCRWRQQRRHAPNHQKEAARMALDQATSLQTPRQSATSTPDKHIPKTRSGKPHDPHPLACGMRSGDNRLIFDGSCVANDRAPDAVA